MTIMFVLALLGQVSLNPRQQDIQPHIGETWAFVEETCPVCHADLGAYSTITSPNGIARDEDMQTRRDTRQVLVYRDEGQVSRCRFHLDGRRSVVHKGSSAKGAIGAPVHQILVPTGLVMRIDRVYQPGEYGNKHVWVGFTVLSIPEWWRVQLASQPVPRKGRYDVPPRKKRPGEPPRDEDLVVGKRLYVQWDDCGLERIN